jgi:hypothetical protein
VSIRESSDKGRTVKPVNLYDSHSALSTKPDFTPVECCKYLCLAGARVQKAHEFREHATLKGNELIRRIRQFRMPILERRGSFKRINELHLLILLARKIVPPRQWRLGYGSLSVPSLYCANKERDSGCDSKDDNEDRSVGECLHRPPASGQHHRPQRQDD